MQSTPTRRAPARDTPGVRSVSVFSTGTVDIHPQHAFGSRIPTSVWVLASRRWLPPRPINVYVIEHRDGLVLFDTGQDRASVTDRGYFPRGPLGYFYQRLARFHIGAHDSLSAQLRARGYAPSDVGLAVLSHLHQDHIGGVRALPDAEFVVAAAEWEQLLKPLPEARGLLRRHIDLPGIHWRRLDFQPTDDPTLAPFSRAYDLLGDRSLVLLPTPGHTPGSMSLLVRRPSGAPLLLVGDLTYAAELLEQGRVPGVGDQGRLRATTEMVRRLKQRMPDLVILPAHDPGAAERLQRATINF
jgi:N-acyl homoserine lactone hydrolase